MSFLIIKGLWPTFIGGFTTAYGKLKEIGFEHWEMPNLEAANESGFAARPGGYRNPDGSFGGECIWAVFGMANAILPVYIIKIMTLVIQ